MREAPEEQPIRPWKGRCRFVDGVLPSMHSTAPKFATATDFRLAPGIKCLQHDKGCEFHSYSEYLFGALLDGDPDVVAWVPQSHQLKIGNRVYVPDFWVQYHDRQVVYELKPESARKRWEIETRNVKALLEVHAMAYEFMSNEMVVSRETEARNWRRIVQVYHQGLLAETSDAESTILAGLRLAPHKRMQLGDILSAGDHSNSPETWLTKLGLCRLLALRAIKAELDTHPLNPNTMVSM